MKIRRPTFSLAVLPLAGLLVAPSIGLAHDEHGAEHQELNAEHQEGHDDLNAEHEAGHDQLDAEHEASVTLDGLFRLLAQPPKSEPRLKLSRANISQGIP